MKKSIQTQKGTQYTSSYGSWDSGSDKALTEESKKSVVPDSKQDSASVHDRWPTGAIWPTIKYLMTFYAVAMVTSVGALSQAWNVSQVRPILLSSFDEFSKGLVFAFLVALLSIIKPIIIETSIKGFGHNDDAWMILELSFAMFISFGVVVGYSQFFCTITSALGSFYEISNVALSRDIFPNLESCGGAFSVIDSAYSIIVDFLKWPGNVLDRHGESVVKAALSVIGLLILLIFSLFLITLLTNRGFLAFIGFPFLFLFLIFLISFFSFY